MSAYYNEFDPKAAAWLRELIAQGHIAYGDVDERSIEDVTPGDLKGYTQCHFFAGIGVWSYALRRAGWADEEPVWTGSCPCQPFSTAGKGGGFADERHLWPAFHHLIRECRPPVVFGEQVASKAVDAWVDLVHLDLEAVGYAFGSVPFPAASVGAPHIRDRNWWAGERQDNAAGARRFGALGGPEGTAWDEARLRLLGAGGRPSWVGDPSSPASQRDAGTLSGTEAGEHGSGKSVDGRLLVGPEHAGTGVVRMEHTTRDGRIERGAEPGWRGTASGRGLGGLADRDDAGLEGRGQPGRERAAERAAGPGGVAGGLAEPDNPERRPDATGRHDGIGPDAGRSQGASDAEGRGGNGRPGPTNGFWRDADWLHCRDGKWRPVESSAQQMVDGFAEGVGHLRLERDGEGEDEAASEARPDEGVPDLRRRVGEETLQRSVGGHDSVQEAGLLRPGVHGAGLRGPDKGAERQELAAAVCEGAQGNLRALRPESAPRPPQGLGPDEQLCGKPREPVRFMSQAGTPPPGCYPLAAGVQHRAGLLRGYGNAIVAPAAQAFIEAYLESRRERFRLMADLTDDEDIFA